jgi:hypothetical protein
MTYSNRIAKIDRNSELTENFLMVQAPELIRGINPKSKISNRMTVLQSLSAVKVTYSHVKLSTVMTWASLQPDEGCAKFPLWYYYP